MAALQVILMFLIHTELRQLASKRLFLDPPASSTKIDDRKSP